MVDEPENIEFATVEALISFVRERTDDVDEVVIPVQQGIAFRGPAGQQIQRRDAGACFTLCSGETFTVHRDVAEQLLNDGILQRMKIPVRLSLMDGRTSQEEA